MALSNRRWTDLTVMPSSARSCRTVRSSGGMALATRSSRWSAGRSVMASGSASNLSK